MREMCGRKGGEDGERRVKDMKHSATKKKTRVRERIKGLTSQQSVIDN